MRTYGVDYSTKAKIAAGGENLIIKIFHADEF